MRAAIAELADVLADITAAASDRGHITPLLDSLAGTRVIAHAVHCRARGNAPFVLVDSRKAEGCEIRSWTRWPLRRLFAEMRPRWIAHPTRCESALAIPFDFGDERSLVLAVLSRGGDNSEIDDFARAIEQLMIPRNPLADDIPDELPLSPLDPRFAAYALCDALRLGVEEVIQRRAWSLASFDTFRDLRDALEDVPPDIVLIDLDHVADPYGALLRLHTMLPIDVRVIGFGNLAAARFERQSLLDATLDHDAAESQIFTALKKHVRALPHRRKVHAMQVVDAAEIALQSLTSPAKLSERAARQAAELMHGWASLHLVGEAGAVYAAEHPHVVGALATIPKTFLSDRPLFQLRADARFYEEAFDDRGTERLIARLAPVSAACIPLQHADRRVGALRSFSCQEPVDSYTFEALGGLAKIVSRRFDDLLAQAARPAFERSGVWEYVRQGALEFAVYRSRNTALAWDYRAVRTDLGILAIGVEIDASVVRAFSDWKKPREVIAGELVAAAGSGSRFLAACNPLVSTLAYGSHGFPLPKLFDGSGPCCSIGKRGDVLTGTVTVAPPASLMIWDDALRGWLSVEGNAETSVTEAVEDLRPPGVAVLVTCVLPAR